MGRVEKEFLQRKRSVSRVGGKGKNGERKCDKRGRGKG